MKPGKQLNANTSPQSSHRLSLRLEVPCSYTAIREAQQFVHNWLDAQEVPETELNAWDFALVEAGNNAVKFTPKSAIEKAVGIEISLGEKDIEARVTDHTAGFELPGKIDLPSLESEGGRGLFLIKSFTDHIEYLRGHDQNQFVLRKGRATSSQPEAPRLQELQLRLAESEQALDEMADELASTYESLVAMSRYSAGLGSNADLSHFAKDLLADLMKLTDMDAAVLRVFMGEKLELFLALPSALQDQLLSYDILEESSSVELASVRQREDVWFGKMQPLRPNDPLHVIRNAQLGVVHAFGGGGQLLGTLSLVRTRNDVPLRSAQVNLLHTLAEFLAIQIVNARLSDERTQVRVGRAELEIAANIQRSLLPVTLPDSAPFELAVSCANAREVGGDFYDVLKVGNEGLLLLIADVMGKGVPAALFAAVLRSAVRSMPALYTEPAALLTSVNRTLCDDLARVEMFVTAKAVYLDLNKQTITSASAGHCPLLLWKPGQPAAVVADDAGLPLGIDWQTEYKQGSVPFPPGAVALMYTDGLTESHDSTGRMYGGERLAKFVPDLSPQKVPKDQASGKLLAELDHYRAGAALTDDQTFIIIRHLKL